VASKLATTSAAVIVHSTAMLDKVRGLGAPHAAVIPHGSYVGVYPTTTHSPEQAREAVGADSSRFVFLFFGLIRAYKGVPKMVECFLGNFAQEDQLVIAGLCLDPSVLPAIPHDGRQNVIFHNERVPDSQVATYYQAADVACLPFERITTSGSALLALSFGVPIVAPRLGAIIDMPDEVGWFYEPEDAEGLLKAMRRARRASPEERQARSDAARRHAEALAWDSIAAQTMAIYRSVTAGPGAPGS
jgi:glycosyltransferase involved in cell wall biosynthesis